jgi:hypothetical protein
MKYSYRLCVTVNLYLLEDKVNNTTHIIYLFLVYLTTLSVAQATQSLMMGNIKIISPFAGHHLLLRILRIMG